MTDKVAFICVHNSCRSQIAEALAKHLGEEYLEVYSAGTHLKDRINPDAVRLMKEMYSIDMEANQAPKLIQDIPAVDHVVTMGCGVECPMMTYTKSRQDWGLDDPTGQSDSVFRQVIQEIHDKVLALIDYVQEEES